MPVVHVLIEQPTPRARHAVRSVLGDLLGWEVEFASDGPSFFSMEGPRMFYGHAPHPEVFQIRPEGLLHERDLRRTEPRSIERNGLPMLFPVEGGDLPFDPFAAAFWLMTRMEEWCGVGTDEHGRPRSSELHPVRHGYVERPVVDEWAILMSERWRALFPGLPRPLRRYRQVVTIDLDNGFKYLGRPLWRSLGSVVRDMLHGHWSEVLARMATWSGAAPDPYDIYTALRGPMTRSAERTLFFVLASPRGPMDHAVPVDEAHYAERLRGLCDWAEMGVHPSYASSDVPGATAREKQTLEAVIGRKITVSRQHFLRTRIPGTYRELEQIGVTEEHSMGLHDRPGFRAGTCTPYVWYDLEQERTSALRIHPFAVMDNTLRQKMALTPDQAVQRVLPLVERLRALDGTFTGLWHESFLGNDPINGGWREAIHQIIDAARA